MSFILCFCNLILLSDQLVFFITTINTIRKPLFDSSPEDLLCCFPHCIFFLLFPLVRVEEDHRAVNMSSCWSALWSKKEKDFPLMHWRARSLVVVAGCVHVLSERLFERLPSRCQDIQKISENLSHAVVKRTHIIHISISIYLVSCDVCTLIYLSISSFVVHK